MDIANALVWAPMTAQPHIVPVNTADFLSGQTFQEVCILVHMQEPVVPPHTKGGAVWLHIQQTVVPPYTKGEDQTNTAEHHYEHPGSISRARGRITLSTLHRSTRIFTSKHFRIHRRLFLTTCRRQSHGQTGALLWFNGGLQRIPPAMLAGPGVTLQATGERCLLPHAMTLPAIGGHHLPFTVRTLRATSALLDSGSAGNFISGALCRQLKLKTTATPSTYQIHLVTERPLSRKQVRFSTGPIQIQVGILLVEQLHLLVLEESTADMILGRPWLEQHNPVISWKTGEILKWGDNCFLDCFPELPIPTSPCSEDLPVCAISSLSSVNYICKRKDKYHSSIHICHLSNLP
ncbi:hypothetical protein DPX16_21309 [Anabarilius grahami]|uniref:Retrotransposon-derived protein PEG10 n=1 Tax=Anabarilius grahami TaxID=495550 RepID=A0A3N0Y1F7_ANAGA|nr:hypothetical protein DPX16_21309 [Anabarilius grahami]